jgi:hypothetical protein
MESMDLPELAQSLRDQLEARGVLVFVVRDDEVEMGGCGLAPAEVREALCAGIRGTYLDAEATGEGETDGGYRKAGEDGKV